MPRRPKLGQHLLRDPRLADRIVAHADLTPDDVVLEIGPGKGVLTRRLVDAARHVVAVELDEDLADHLKDHVDGTFDLVRGDAVKVAWPPFTACVSNLPYQVSSPILFRLLDEGPALGMTRAVLMVQKEFADRLVAAPGTKDYGRLTVERVLRADARLLERVGRGAFDPPPKVESAVVGLVPRPPPFHVVDEALFHDVVRAAFTQRRKTLRNALRNTRHLLPAGVDVDAAPHGDVRPDQLPPEGFAEVANALAAARE